MARSLYRNGPVGSCKHLLPPIEMIPLTVLSPHQDDAALSLAMTIRVAARNGHPVRVVNCFTVSNFAPHSTARGAAEVGELRRAEDREFASRAGVAVEMVDLGMEDAPIRLRCTVLDVRRLVMGRRERADAARIADAVSRFAEGVVLAPLGLGRHIDHLVVREAAALLARSGRKVVFYEDLPYAAELRECCILRTADGAAARLGARLHGGLVRDPEAASRKRFAIEAYGSQLAVCQIDSIVEYGARRGGERLWSVDESGVPGVERAGIATGRIGAVWTRRLQCAAHAAARRSGWAVRRATELVSGGVNAPQTN